MSRRKWVGAITAAVIAAAAAAPAAQAAALSFDDVARDASWSLASVVELTQRGIFTGYEDGTFAPNRAVTRIEALAAIVRHMGLREEAESSSARRARLSAADADLIRSDYGWATGYVEVAEDYELLDDEKAAFKPGATADRLWAAKLLVRALGLAEEAEAAMGASLPFQDRSEVRKADIGFVAVAAERQLVTGYEDGTFRPSRRVSRAELAALLDRAGNLIPDASGEFGQVAGTVSAVYGSRVTIKQQQHVEQAFYIGPEATVVRSGKMADIADLVPGDAITLLLRGVEVVHLGVTAAATVSDGTKTGKIVSVGVGMLSIDEAGTARSYKVHADAVVERNGRPAQWTELKEGDTVTASVVGGFVARVDAAQSAVQDGRFMGTVKSVEGKRMVISADGVDMTYEARDDVSVQINNVPAAWSQIQAGGTATVVVSGGAVFHVSVTQDVAASTEVEGHVVSVYPTQMLLARNGANEVFTLSNTAQIFRNGAQVALTELVPGDKVRLILENRAVNVVVVVETAKETVQTGLVRGTYIGHSYAAGRIVQLSIRVEQNGIPLQYTYNVATDATIIGGAENLIFDRTTVELLVNEGTVTHIFIR